MKRKLLLLLVVPLLATACARVPQLSNGKDAVVTFKNEALSISADELFEELKAKFALNVLVDMIDLRILQDKYPDEEANAQLAADKEMEWIKSNFLDDDDKFDEMAMLQYLNQMLGVSSIEAYEAILFLNYYRNLAALDFAKEQITNKQIKTHYENEIVGDIEASHILIRPDVPANATDAQKKAAEEEALKKARDIIRQLDNGADFAKLAADHSADRSNAENGGKLGYFNKGDMVAEFEKAAFALRVGSYTKEPVKTQHGFHIILKTGEKDKPTLEEATDQIKTTLGTQLLDKDATVSINALIELRKAYGFKIHDTGINKDYARMINNQLISARNRNQEQQ